MKRILIARSNSDIGLSIERYLLNDGDYQVDTLSLIGDTWKNSSLECYDSIINVTGILVIQNYGVGVFHPQNSDYVPDSEDVYIQAKAMGRKVFSTVVFNCLIRLLIGKVKKVERIFGEDKYSHSLSTYDQLDCQIFGFAE